ncbi:MAG TPA: hypothetical protein VD866_05685 [Urbifossiella sp.]|nr:hypothetical protein [Urbifossiella sp.]
MSLEAPRPVRAQLTRLAHADPAVRTAAAAELAADDKNAPFLRFERVAAATDAHRAAFDAALAPIEARIRARTRDRVKDWAKERRLDLLGHVLADGPEADVADVVDRVLGVQHDILKAAWPDGPPADFGVGFAPARALADIRPPSGRLPITPTPGDEEAADGLLFAGRRVVVPAATASRFDRAGLVAGANGGVRLARSPPEAGLYQAVLLANGPVELAGALRTLVVADGDVVLTGRAVLSRTVVVATGSVTATGERRQAMDHTRVYAAGSIDLPNALPGIDCEFRAGGRVNLESATKLDAAGGVKGTPFGIRFVTPAEFGFRAAPADGGLAVAAVEAWSPLARYDVRPGDVVTHVGFDTVRTADALRRALRRGLTDEAAVFHVVRGVARLTRVVYLDGVPRRP